MDKSSSGGNKLAIVLNYIDTLERSDIAMGEAIIARGQTASKNVLHDIPVSGDYCSILVLLEDSTGKPCKNTKINCIDGTRSYNYTTNENGYALFKCNSGSANIIANNWINGVYTFDQAAVSKDYDAPVGTKRLEKISFGKINHFSSMDTKYKNYSGQFVTIDQITNVVVVGGGGGGAGGYAGSSMNMAGGGGGGGAKNYLSSFSIVKGQIYKIIIGNGGNGGGGVNGNSGATSYAFGLSANGGGGGAIYTKAGTGGIGKYNGGNGSNSLGHNGNDGINGAGGGGGCGWCQGLQDTMISYGGKNGGGNGYSHNAQASVQSIEIYFGKPGNYGSGGGGGGGSSGYWSYYSQTSNNGYGGGNGGSGRVEFDM